MITNPVLPGFNADPSILRVGGDFYIATSTFEWFPGVAIYHSRDLEHWSLRGHALTRRSQLELRGVQGSGGVWAPSLNYREEDGLFYLAWTNVHNSEAAAFDLRNYLVTAPSIDGPWSENVYLNASGFDPCVFFDGGRVWIANLEWEFRKGYEHPGWIVLQEYSVPERRLVGEPRRIYHGGSDMGCMEGPVLFKREGWYYLITAEGGTGYGHSAIIARSRELPGPYESDPAGPLLSVVKEPFFARGERDFLKARFFNPEAALQKTGHASLVSTGTGEWYLAHLCARPLRPELRAFLNRETALRRAFWTEDGWLRAEGGRLPLLEVEGPAGIPSSPIPSGAIPAVPERGVGRREDFDAPTLPADLYSLRCESDPSWLDLSSRPGWLRLRGRQSLRSLHEQSLVARRVQHFDFRIEASLDFEPRRYQAMAGIVLMLGTQTWYYLRKYWSESLGGPALGVMSCLDGTEDELLEHRVALAGAGGHVGVGANPEPAGHPLLLAAEVAGGRELAFSWSRDGAAWERIGPLLDASRLSDECVRHEAFSGTFCGLCVQDLSGQGAWASFDYFDYQPRDAGRLPRALESW
jgi:xylan 1,4-beta-xylosidase